MTKEELYSVRNLQEVLTEKRRRLAELESLVMHVTRELDGMPHAKRQRSAVEELTIKKVALEQEIAVQEAELAEAREVLMGQILNELTEPALAKVALYRYVSCFSWKETARLSHFALSYVFRLNARLHKNFVRG